MRHCGSQVNEGSAWAVLSIQGASTDAGSSLWAALYHLVLYSPSGVFVWRVAKEGGEHLLGRNCVMQPDNGTLENSGPGLIRPDSGTTKTRTLAALPPTPLSTALDPGPCRPIL